MPESTKGVVKSKRPVAFCPACGHSSGGQPYCPSCGMSLRFTDHGHPEIQVHGTDANEVERVSKALMAVAPESRVKKQFPLVSGVFFLVMFIVVFGAILSAAKILPVYVFPIVLIGGILTFSVIGAFILRQDENLSEKGFLDLMKASFRYLPLLRKR